MIKKLILISAASFLNKIFFILLPYLIESGSYYNFNNKYFTASFVSLLVLSGFDFVYARFNILRNKLILIFVINSILFVTIIQLTNHNIDLWILLLLLFNIFFSLISTVLLFENKILHYFILSFLSFLLSISAVILHNFLKVDLFIIFVILNFLLIFYLIRFKKGERSEELNSVEFYKIGFSIFLINSAAGLYFSLNKYIANNYFSVDTANSFTFAWMTLVPMLYIGNIFEKFIYSSDNLKINRKRFLLISAANSISGLFYTILLYSAFSLFELFPKAINSADYFSFFIPIGLGLFIFSSIHFPLNGFLFKYNSKIAQKRTALFNIPVLLISIILIFYLASIQELSIVSLIAISFLSLILINILKGYFIFNEIRKERSK